MMLQAASRQSPGGPGGGRCSSGHRRTPTAAAAAGGSGGHHRPKSLGCHPGNAGGFLTDEEFENQRSGRLASALLFMSVLVLMVDATRIILYSWFTDGSYLKFLYGSELEIRWPKCSSGGGGGIDIGLPAGEDEASPTPRIAVRISSLSGQRQQQQQDDQQLDQFKATLMSGLSIAGRILDAAFAAPGDAAVAPRRVGKPLVRVLFHASTVVCLFFLAVAVFPAALRVRRRGGCGCCLLSSSLAFSIATLLAAGASAASSLMSIYFFGACELQPSLCRVYDFVPSCEPLRRAFLGAECFSLVVVCACVCVLLHLIAYFCRTAAQACGGCCRRRRPGLDGNGGSDRDRYDFELARPGRQPLTVGRTAFDEEEYLA